MSFGSTAKQPRKPKQPLTTNPERLASNLSGVPVQYFAGRQRLGLTDASDAYAVRSQRVRERVGKKRQTVGYNYFASFARIGGVGPLDWIGKIWFDDQLVWTGDITRGAEDSVPITIPNYGDVTLYWGTETQDADAGLVAAGQGHSALRGQWYFVFDDLFFGFNKTNAPSMEILGARYPTPAWMTPDPEIVEDINLVAVVWEILTHPRFGLGLPEARLNPTAMDAVAVRLNTEGVGISPILNRAETLAQFLTRLLEYVDGYVTEEDDGTIGLGLVRDDWGSVIALDESDLLEEPDLKPQTFEETQNLTRVTWTDRRLDYKEGEPSIYRDRGNFQVTGILREQTVDRPWITRPNTAQRIAGVLGRRAAIPATAGSISARASSVGSARPGDVVTLSWDDLDLVSERFRILRVPHPAPGRPEVTLDIEADRSHLYADFYVPEDDPILDPTLYSAEPPPHQLAIETPYAIIAGEFVESSYFVTRANRVHNGFNAWFRRWNGEMVTLPGFEGTAFAQRGHLLGDYPADTLTIDEETRLELEFDTDDDTIDDTYVLNSALANELLLLVNDEIISLFDAELIAAGQWRFSCVRGRYDTRAMDHATNDAAFLLPLEDWQRWRADGPLTPHRYKFQPFILQSQADLDLCPEFVLPITRRSYRPLGPLNLQVNGDGVNPTYSTTEDVLVTFTLADPRRPLVPLDAVLVPQVSGMIYEIRHPSTGALLSTIPISGVTQPDLITNAQLQTALGGETDFLLRAWTQRSNLRSRTWDDVFVHFV